MILTPSELVELTGKQRPYAQAKELDHLGIEYKTRLNGSLVVYRHALQSPSNNEVLPDFSSLAA